MKLFLVALLFSSACAVEITVDTSRAPDLNQFGDTVRNTLLDWFDRVGEILYSPTYNAPSTITVFFDPEYDGVAYASGNRIVGSVDYYRTHQSDIGSMVHEMAHVIQSYKSCYTNDDWWITEGIADWVRLYRFEPVNAPSKPGANQNYTDGYRVTAFFLNYVNSRYDPMIYWINKDCREGTYAHEIFPRLTGKTLNELWADMMRETNAEVQFPVKELVIGEKTKERCMEMQIQPKVITSHK